MNAFVPETIPPPNRVTQENIQLKPRTGRQGLANLGKDDDILNS